MVFTQKVRWFFDLNTVADTMNIITINTGGEYIKKRLAPWFAGYKYFRLGRVSIRIVPSTTLPLDPLQLSLNAEDPNTLDPRDMLSPGLVRITNGEDVCHDISHLDADSQRALYNTMLLDNRWFKWSTQGGLRKSAVPLYWQIGQYHQDMFPGTVTNIPIGLTEPEYGTLHNQLFADGSKQIGAGSVVPDNSTGTYGVLASGSNPRGIFQTGMRGRIGWMPTDAYQPMLHPHIVEDVESGVELYGESFTAPIPSVELFTIVTPPTHKVSFYWRVYVEESVSFKGVISNMNTGFATDDPYLPVDLNSYSSIDRFVRPRMPVPMFPTDQDVIASTAPRPNNDGQVGDKKEVSQ